MDAFHLSWVVSLAVTAVVAGTDLARAAGAGFGDGVEVAIVTSGNIGEASGLGAGRSNPDVLWLHNDSGDRARVYALAMDGTLKTTYNLVGAKAVDYEDLALGPGPEPGTTYLYVGDIGDNFSARKSIVVYRVPEPDTARASAEIDLEGVAALELRYPDGAHDAEGLLCDPRTGDLFIVTKDVHGANQVFRAPFPQSEHSPTVVEPVATIRFSGASASELAATGGDISASGDLIIMRSYNKALLWQREAGQTVAQALQQPPRPISVPGPPTEQQGEAIAFSADGNAYFTIGEGIGQPLYRFDRASAVSD